MAAMNGIDFNTPAVRWSEADRQIVAQVEPTLARALELRRWWQLHDRHRAYRDAFELVRSFNDAETSFGFFDDARIGDRAVPVMGTVEELAYDQPKKSHATAVRREFREFVLRYFLRVSDFREPAAAFDDTPRRIGFGYSQHYYKLRRSGAIGKFDSRDAFAIVDLRDLFTKYEWIVLKVSIFDFNFTIGPLTETGPSVTFPLTEQSYLVITRDFVLDRTSAGVSGAYGFGYAFLKDVEPKGLLAYGPGHFDVAFESVTFQVRSNGEMRAQLVFVANRPTRLLNVPLDPLDWGLWIADAIAVRRPWTEWLDRRMLLQHFQQHYAMVTGSLLTWRHVPDWLNTRTLPAWVRTGISA
jgi:hypothetical protein